MQNLYKIGDYVQFIPSDQAFSDDNFETRIGRISIFNDQHQTFHCTIYVPYSHLKIIELREIQQCRSSCELFKTQRIEKEFINKII